jgi:putative sterol carrier protein
MADLFTADWAAEVKDAINTYPDDEYRATKLDLFWNWIDEARRGFSGMLVLGVRDLPTNSSAKLAYATFAIKEGQVTDTAIVEDVPEDATYVLVGKFDVWKDITEGYDCGKAVMYRRLRLEKGDVFRFFNRIYFFTESLVALSKVPTKLPA